MIMLSMISLMVLKKTIPRRLLLRRLHLSSNEWMRLWVITEVEKAQQIKIKMQQIKIKIQQIKPFHRCLLLHTILCDLNLREVLRLVRLYIPRSVAALAAELAA